MQQVTCECRGCGAPATTDSPIPSMCQSCHPRHCVDCGLMDSLQSPCPCWVSVESMNLADLKALFSRDGTFNLAPDGTIRSAA
jgi:hypothetical protein